MNLDDIYSETIMDHSQSPRNYGHLDQPAKIAGLRNPTCGDQIILELTIEGDVITDIRFSGKGCSISIASASMLTQAIRGKKIRDALTFSSNFKASITGGNSNVDLGEMEALRGVSQFPNRVKCASLSINALEKAINEYSDGI